MRGDFPPIAIVGQGCVLPRAFDPAALWTLLARGACVVGPIPEGRWRAARSRILITPSQRDAGAEGSITDRGGWVQGFDQVFNPAGLGLGAADLDRLDPLVAWLLHAGQAALAEAGLAPGAPGLARAGAVFGHLAYPSTGLAEFAEALWLGRHDRPDPRNRFNAGLPADLLCQGLGLGAGGFTLDAACASSLYAVKLACDRLQAGEVDIMLAGGISRIDPLVLHAGFTALGAISPTGQSRPFHEAADGLLPAEGAALLALKRLEDAQQAGDDILAVIFGIGLSNDGRSGGLLAPSVEGQTRAMAEAFARSGLTPDRVSLIECHATGTVLGDATEIESTGRIYAEQGDLPVGSIKSNFGHLTTASGAAGLLKLVLGLRHGIRPPTLHCDPLAQKVAASRFRPLRAAEPWPQDTPRLAAISNFGFGGANAHLLLGDAGLAPPRSRPSPRPAARPSQGRIAVIGLGAQVADGVGLDAFRAQLFQGVARGAAHSIAFAMGEIRFPPRDLERTLPQHLMVLRAAIDALATLQTLPDRTGVFVGAQTDPDSCRHGLRLRLAELAADAAPEQAMRFRLDAAGTVGGMPNIPANRINMQFDLQGPGFTVAAEELSGLRALDLAIRALTAHEVDAALAGAVDLSVEPVHTAALAALRHPPPRTGDGAVVLVLKRETDARRDGDPILALVDPGSPEGETGLDWSSHADRLTETFGSAHAASGLIAAAAAVLALQAAQLPPDRQGHAARPWPPHLPRRIRLQCRALGGQSMTMSFSAPPPDAPAIGPYARAAVSQNSEAW